MSGLSNRKKYRFSIGLRQVPPRQRHAAQIDTGLRAGVGNEPAVAVPPHHIGDRVQTLPVRHRLHQVPEHELRFADGDGIHLGDEEILRQKRRVVPPHYGEDLRGEGFDLLQYPPRGVDLGGQRGDRYHLRLEASQGGIKIAVQVHVKNAKIVLRNRRGRHLQVQRLRQSRHTKSDPSGYLGLNQ